MTVTELIGRLQEMPPGAEVQIHSRWADGELMPIEKVEHQPAIPNAYVTEYVWIE